MLIQDEEYQDDGFVVEDVESIIHLSIQEIMFAQAAERSLSDQRSQGFTRLNVVNAMIGAVEDRMNNHLAIGRYTRIQNNNQRGRGRGRGRGILRSNG
ncbi:MAG: hypothetical protein EZS28_013116 [Streblomastix strix]|uniref:Uncharacterized protein n=1 Tax=Streblomastix strix TaxID=222440 RepID=A0A5J4W9L2_9EUKA|nr:MAG: hypothetical protein EZS28_013116 [Streblomastix strix]